MNALVIKAGGNVLHPRDTQSIDRGFVRSFGAYVAELLLESRDRVVVVPGGVGGELFIRWGREEGCSEAELDEIGCCLIGMTGSILIRALKGHVQGIRTVCPIVPTTLRSLTLALDRYRVVVSGCAIPSAMTSDSLAARIAEHVDGELALVKSAKPFDPETSFYVDATHEVISLRKLLDFHNSLALTEVAGHHPSIDYQCLRIIRRAKLRASVLLKSSIVNRTHATALRPIDIRHDC